MDKNIILELEEVIAIKQTTDPPTPVTTVALKSPPFCNTSPMASFLRLEAALENALATDHKLNDRKKFYHDIQLLDDVISRRV